MHAYILINIWVNGQTYLYAYMPAHRHRHKHIHTYNSYIRGLSEKFIGWLRYSHGMWPNEVYFKT